MLSRDRDGRRKVLAARLLCNGSQEAFQTTGTSVPAGSTSVVVDYYLRPKMACVDTTLMPCVAHDHRARY